MKSKSKKPWERTYIIGEKKTDELIAQLAGIYGTKDTEELLRQIITTAVKMGKEGTDVGDIKLANASFKELRHAFRVFSTFREVRKVIVFGSSRAKRGSATYKLAEALSGEITKRGFMIITGAGPGIMEAANKGAGAKKSFGVNIKLPFTQEPNPYIKDSDYLVNFKYFFVRKLIFIKESDATVLFPGGFGTHDEGFENLTLIQTGKCRPRPVVLMEPKQDNYWQGWRSFIQNHLLKKGYISKDDLKLFTYESDIKKAADYIENFYKVYHSIRYIKDLTVIRLNHPLSEEMMHCLKNEFGDILDNGYIRNSCPLPEEIEKNEYPYLPRLVMKFKKGKYGRLCEMIHTINKE